MAAAPANACTDLASAATPTLEITSATREGTACHVEAIARPRPNARIAISLWLPSAERWSGRYYQMGNGGFAGSIDRATLAAAAARGDVAAATDTGHIGTGFDAGWAQRVDERILKNLSRLLGQDVSSARQLLRVKRSLERKAA